MVTPANFTTRPEIAGTFGVVASSHWLASQVGMGMLERGGNAFDAAVAAGLVLQVVEPHMNGLGGDAVILIHPGGAPGPKVICGQGPAPAGATIAHYRREGLELVPGTGLLAAVVPGAFDAWMLMLRDFGTMSLAEVMEPAISYARDGYPLIAGAANAIAGVAELFRGEWQSSAAIYLPGNAAPSAGALFANRDLADTYARILAEAVRAGSDRERQIETARNCVYKGFIAEAIEKFATRTAVMDASGRRHRGVLAAADLAAWRATYEAPATRAYRGLVVAKPGPWSQGPVMLQVLALIEGFDIAGMDTGGAEFLHTVLEAQKLAYADREAWYGDPDFVDVPLEALLSDAYNDARRKLIAAAASRELRPGSPDGRRPILAARQSGIALAAGVGEPSSHWVEGVEIEIAGAVGGGAGDARGRAARGPAEGDTCHLDVIDRHGNMVAATPSGGWLQSSPVIPGLGFCLGTRAQMFWLEEGLPASLAPGRRPRTTLTPSLALKDGAPYLAWGSPGGDGQDQWTLQFLLRHVEHRLNLQAAIDAPMWRSDHWPSSFYPRQASPAKVTLEGRFAKATVAELERRGHDVQLADDWALGRTCAASKQGPMLRAAATPRFQQAYALGR
ncbi:MAG: gamma-glutamyltransferase family protein [Pseudomonadota bacterium]